MNGFRAFLRRKNIVFSAKRYGVDALGAMAQGLFCTLLVGTILDTLGTQFHIGFLAAQVVTVGTGEAAVGYTIGGLASLMVGPAMAVAIGSALQAPPLVLFSLVPVGYATNVLGGAGGPLAVLVIAIIAAECGKMVSKETKFHNDLENVDYTATDDGESVVLKGTVGEQWVAKLDKVLETYTKADGTALKAEDFTNAKDTFIDLKTKAEPDTNFACFVPRDVRLTVNTAWGDVLHVNDPSSEHGYGDYLVCPNKDGKPDKHIHPPWNPIIKSRRLNIGEDVDRRRYNGNDPVLPVFAHKGELDNVEVKKHVFAGHIAIPVCCR